MSPSKLNKSQELMSRFFKPKSQSQSQSSSPVSRSKTPEVPADKVIDLSSDVELSDKEEQISAPVLEVDTHVKEELENLEEYSSFLTSQSPQSSKSSTPIRSNVQPEEIPEAGENNPELGNDAYSSKASISGFKYDKVHPPEKSQLSREAMNRHLAFAAKLGGLKSLEDNNKDDIDLEGDDEQDPDEVEPPKKKQKSSKKGIKLTPLEQQFLDLKLKNLDKVLAIQVGYKYKFFGKDAAIVSKILNIMFIPGKVSLDIESPDTDDEKLYDRFAYCSIPDFRLHIHLKRLLINGLKVGVVDQTETVAIKNNGAQKNKLFTRDITNVYTMATYIDNEDKNSTSFSSLRGSYIFAITEIENQVSKKVQISIIAVNLFSAEIVYDEFEDDFSRLELNTRFAHFEPVEFLVIGELSKNTKKCFNTFKKQFKGEVQQLRQSFLTERGSLNDYLTLLHESVTDKIYNFLSVKFTNSKLLILFTEMIIYLKDFNLSNVFELIENYQNFQQERSNPSMMILDSNTLNNLEIFYNSTDLTEKNSLLWLLDHTNTKFGSRMLKKWISRPLTNRELILERLDSVEYITNNTKDQRLEFLLRFLKSCPDLESDLAKLHYGRLTRKQLYMMMRKFNEFIEMIIKLKNKNDENENGLSLSHLLSDMFHTFGNFVDSELSQFQTLFNMINSPAAMDDSLPNMTAHITTYFNFSFYDYGKILKHKEKIEDIEKQLKDQLKFIRPIIKRPQATYISSNKEPYLIDVKNSQVNSLPKDWVKINATKSVSRFRPPEVSALYSKLQYEQELLMVQSKFCFQEYTKKIDDMFQVALHRIVEKLSVMDCLFSLSAISSISSQYSKPELVDEPMIDLKNCINPLVLTSSKMISPSISSISHYIPNDIHMTQEKNRVSIITGPNMGGKSSLIRQIAISVIMCQIGCFVPALSARLGIFDSVFTRMGSQDDIIKGESTFQVEMKECCSIIKSCTSKSLVLLDEIGRGTSTSDGYALAYSILYYLITSQEEGKTPFVLFITHFPELGKLETKFPELVQNYHMGYRSETKGNNNDDDTDDNDEVGDDFLPDLTFLYVYQRGVCSNSYGLHAAKLSGVPMEIIKSAYVKALELKEKDLVNESMSIVKSIKRLTDSNGDNVDDVIDRLNDFL